MNQLKELNVEQSFSRSGKPYDNAVCESFFSNFKQEELYRYEYKTVEEMKRRINKYMIFYNEKRPHSILRYKTPNKVEEQYYDRLRNFQAFNTDTNGSNL